MKITFKKENGALSLPEVLGEDLMKVVTETVMNLKDGEKFELIIRKQERKDIAELRNLFHGPIIRTLMDYYKEEGYAYSHETIKSFLKAHFLGWDEEHWAYKLMKDADDGRRANRKRPLLPLLKEHIDVVDRYIRAGVVLPLKSTERMGRGAYLAFIDAVRAWMMQDLGIDITPIDEMD